MTAKQGFAAALVIMGGAGVAIPGGREGAEAIFADPEAEASGDVTVVKTETGYAIRLT